MKIAFVSANREQLPDPVIPLGILYIMAALPAGHNATLIDLCFEGDPIAHLASRLKGFAPDLIAVGMRNVQNSDYTGISSTVAQYVALMKAVRASSAAPVVLGGGGFSVLPEQLMATLKPDYGVDGEGERVFVQLVHALEAGPRRAGSSGLLRTAGDLSRIGGLLYFDDFGKLRHNARDAFQALDNLNTPQRRGVDPRYLQADGVANLQTKRGCALRCDYCTYPMIEGRTVRVRSPQLVVDEMLALSAIDEVKHIFIVDSVFNIPPTHAKQICRLLIDAGADTPWTCYVNPLGFDADLAALMVQAGARGIEVGADSGCDEILKKLRKGFDTHKLRATSRYCQDVGLRDCHTFLLGTPGETLDHVRRTLDFVVDMDPYAAVLMAYKDDEEAFDEEYALRRQRLRADVLQLLDDQRGDFPRWVIPALEVNFSARLFALLRRKRLDGPLWQHLDLLGLRPKRAAVDVA